MQYVANYGLEDTISRVKIFFKSHPLHYKDLKIELGWHNQMYAINTHLNKKPACRNIFKFSKQQIKVCLTKV